MKEAVSIIIPCYNNHKYLGTAIESCLKQTYENKEVIIIDDHSSDDSFKTANTYSAKYANVKCFLNKGKGANAARNYGVEKSSGKYIQFLDSDDFLYASDLLEKQVVLYEQQNTDSILFCDHASIKEDDFSSLQVHQRYNNYKNPDIRDILIDCIIQTSQIFLKKKVFFDLGGLDEGLVKAQEHDFNVRAASKNIKFVHNDIAGVVIRSHTSAHRISNQNPERTKANDFKVVDKFKKYVLEYVSHSGEHTKRELGNEIIKYLIFRAQQFGNLKDFDTVKDYERRINALKREFKIRRINGYKSKPYTVILDVVGLVFFERARVGFIGRFRDWKRKLL